MQSTCTMILKDGKLGLPWCRCVASAAIQLRKLGVRSTKSPPPERSNPLNGENLKYQVRELRRNFLRSCAVPSALGTSFLVR